MGTETPSMTGTWTAVVVDILRRVGQRRPTSASTPGTYMSTMRFEFEFVVMIVIVTGLASVVFFAV